MIKGKTKYRKYNKRFNNVKTKFAKLKKYNKQHNANVNIHDNGNGNRNINVNTDDIILQIGGNNKNKVLIVVDVQNCFFENFGTMGWLPKDYFATDNKSELNKTRDKVKNEFASRLSNFIKSAQTQYDIIIFTKDRHPLGHRSFGSYPPHCINKAKTCKFTFKQDNAKTKAQNANTSKLKTTHNINSNPQIYAAGHELLSRQLDQDPFNLEYMPYKYKISYDGDINLKTNETEITELTKLDLRGKIQYEMHKSFNNKTFTKTSNLTNSWFHVEKTLDTDAAIIVRLNKGELCNFDAYGAFLYHIEYTPESSTTLNKTQHTRKVDDYNSKFEYKGIGEKDILSDLTGIDDLSKISTGLGEFILKYYNNSLPDNMVIDVCGLVTNICVVNSCIGGIKFFENYKKTKLQAQAQFTVPHFRILNEYSLYLYAYPFSETQALNSSGIGYNIYKNEIEYNANANAISKKLKSVSVSIIGIPAADGYIPINSI